MVTVSTKPRPKYIWTEEGFSRWLVNADFGRPEFLRRLAVPNELMAPPAEPVQRDATPRVTYLVRTKVPELPATPLIIKRYHSKNLLQSLKDLFRPSRARRAFVKAFLLQQYSIPTATPIAAGETRCCRWLKESYLISEEILQAKTLWELRNVAASRHQARILMRALAKMLARLHDAGFSHSDPNIANFLVCGHPYPSPQLLMIDLDGIKQCRRVSPRVAAKHLYRLVRHLTPEERLWFVAQYCRSRQQRLSARDFNRRIDAYPKVTVTTGPRIESQPGGSTR